MILDTIGPYSIEKRLGSGGMGEVYLAHDRRLDRFVALKWIRTDSLQNPRLQQRFLREARAIAKLSHPAIVQIHDILELQDGDCIVMEWVRGRTLSDVLRDGPMPLPRLLVLARDVADGLTEAHRKNILHRDLKTSNIMVTDGGHAKILDFGLAKPLRGEIAQGGFETSLTIPGELLGTVHTMSPEQAQGYPLDPRSDLFSFGVVLYEAATGRRPFRGKNVPGVLNQILKFRQLPAQELAPSIPERLSDLIDHLLEKDPNHRPANAVAVAAVLEDIESSDPSLTTDALAQADDETLVLGGEATPDSPKILGEGSDRSPALDHGSGNPRWRWLIGLAAGFVLLAFLGRGLFNPAPADEAPLYVAVVQPRVDAPNSEVVSPDLLATAVRLAIVRGLIDLEGLVPLSLNQVDDVQGNSPAVARAVAADHVLTTQMGCSPRQCQVMINRLDGEASGISAMNDFTIPIDDMPLIHNAVTQNLRAIFPEHEARPGGSVLEVTHADYEQFVEVRESFQSGSDREALAALLEQLDQIQRSSPRFLDAFVLEAQILYSKFHTSQDPQDLERAFAAIAQARTLSANDPRPLFTLFTLQVAANRLDEAAAVLADLESLQPGDATVLAKRAILEDHRGNASEALREIREAVARHPSWANLYRQARIAYRQGKIDEARQSLLQALERFPNHFPSLSFLAQLELLSGQPESVELYRELVEHDPNGRELANLGTALILDQRYPEALDVLRRAIELEPEDWPTVLSLAIVEMLRGRADIAEPMLHDVLRSSQGRSDAETLLLRGQTFALLGEDRQAATAVREALQQSPPHPFQAYQAALTYAVLGDENASIAQMEQALELNLGPRWFALPFFDSLRDHPDFRQVLEQHGGAEFLSPRPVVEEGFFDSTEG